MPISNSKKGQYFLLDFDRAAKAATSTLRSSPRRTPSRIDSGLSAGRPNGPPRQLLPVDRQAVSESACNGRLGARVAAFLSARITMQAATRVFPLLCDRFWPFPLSRHRVGLLAGDNRPMASRLRLADLLAGFSIVVDLGYGLPMETAMRSCLLGTALARRLGLEDRGVAEVFYVSLLLHVGCLAYSHETAAWFGDDAAVRRAVVRTNNPLEIFTVLIPEATRGLPPGSRLMNVARFVSRGPGFSKRHDLASCESARAVARRIGLPNAVSDALYDVHEWWNGRGARRLKGEAIAVSARIARVATDAVFLAALRDPDAVTFTLQAAAGKRLDPSIVAVLEADAPGLLAEAGSGDPRLRILDAEPGPAVVIDPPELALVAAAFGDLADIKTPFTHGHSAGVARLSVAAASRLRLDRETIAHLEVAAYLHDLGRGGVSNAVWEKPALLTTADWEQVRMHTYYTERILSASAALAPVAAIACLHHERLDGSGYHRGCRGTDIGTAARVLAAADSFQAMIQSRPHRAALDPDQARDELLGEARRRRLDSDVVAAVLDAADQPVAPVRDLRPAGLSEREVEVLRLVAEGCSNPEIGRRLSISPRTAEHHVQHIYTKLGVSTRVAAVLLALEHNLLESGSHS
jgi:HD-GYP domain-containing protein (c-di-GMP phosphodiesterase class II)